MKLLTKNNFYTSMVSILPLILGIGIVYFLILNKIDHEDQEHLLGNKATVLNLLKQGKSPESFNSNIEAKISVAEIPSQTIKNNVFRDYEITEDFDDDDDARVMRELLFQTKIAGKIYEIKISHSLSEGKEITKYLANAIIIFLFFSLFVLLLINWVISRHIWNPFHDSLAAIKKWAVTENALIHFNKTNIDEFQELNNTLLGFIKKIRGDYVNLKEFTENISHETQTPVAVISSKIELLMQSNNYSEQQNKLLSEAYQATQHLKKLNETLILLSRIENNQFAGKEKIDLSAQIKNKVKELNDFIEEQKITVALNLRTVEKRVNPMLFNVVLNNLLINAIKHNYQTDGYIDIVLNDKVLTISNSSLNKEINNTYLFERFKVYTTNEDSIGLGLSIIKRAIDIIGWEIKYRHQDNVHIFEINWEE